MMFKNYGSFIIYCFLLKKMQGSAEMQINLKTNTKREKSMPLSYRYCFCFSNISNKISFNFRCFSATVNRNNKTCTILQHEISYVILSVLLIYLTNYTQVVYLLIKVFSALESRNKNTNYCIFSVIKSTCFAFFFFTRVSWYQNKQEYI